MTSVVEIDGQRLAYDDTGGSGPVVVLSHASLTDRRMWRAQVASLAERFRVLAYDRLGFGESDPAPATVRPGADLLRVLDALGVEHAALVGCSMGAGYSLDAALLAPERVWALGLICPGVPGYVWPAEMMDEVRPLLHRAVPAERLARYADRSATAVLDADVAAIAEMQLRYMALGDRDPAALPGGTWAFLLEMCSLVFAREWSEPASNEPDYEPPVLQRLTEVAIPTLVINGECDVSYIQQLARMLSSGIPGARHIDLADTGHLAPVERPDAVDGLLLPFLTGAFRATLSGEQGADLP